MKHANILTKKIKLFSFLMSFVKNLGNNAVFSKVFTVGMKRGDILQKHPEILQNTGYFPMWFFLKSLQNYRKLQKKKEVIQMGRFLLG